MVGGVIEPGAAGLLVVLGGICERKTMLENLLGELLRRLFQRLKRKPGTEWRTTDQREFHFTPGLPPELFRPKSEEVIDREPTGRQSRTSRGSRIESL